MKKNFKLVLALVLSIMMMLGSMSALAAAVDPTYSLTINKAEAGHTYTAYQIFAGTVTNTSGTANEDNKLGSVSWGDGISNAGQAAMLSYKKSGGETWADAADLAAHIGTGADDAIAFADAVDEYLVSSNGHAGSLTNDVYTISDLPAGYYIVVDTYDNPSGKVQGKDYTISRYMVQVVGNATVTNKADVPTVEKKLKNEGEQAAAYRDANNVGIDDIVNYRITSKVPNMADYKQYFFIMHDHLSKGLTLQDENNAGFTVKVGDTTLTRVADAAAAESANPTTVYYITKNTEADGSTKFDIVFHDFLQYKGQFGAAVEVTYNAKLNASAIVGTEGNPNEIYLQYSHNPSQEDNGKDIPDNDNVTGRTPSDWTKTYTVNLKLLKIDGTDSTKLKGVKFNVNGYKMNDVVTTYTETYTKFEGAGNPTEEYKYWKLNTNPVTYTDIAPNSFTSSKYASTEEKYKLTVTESTQTTSNGTEMVTFAGQTTGDDGYIALEKIPAGKYVFTEVSTLDGYNLLTAPVVIEIKADTNVGAGAPSGTSSNKEISNGTETCTWSATKDGTALTYNNGIFGFEFTVVNNKGAQLPETGGIGTTIFYVAGSILVLAAAILLITKRRMGSND